MYSVGFAGFASEQCPEGFVAVAKNTLRILTLERLGETFNQQSCPLRYTPRKFVIHPEHKVCLLQFTRSPCLQLPVLATPVS